MGKKLSNVYVFLSSHAPLHRIDSKTSNHQKSGRRKKKNEPNENKNCGFLLSRQPRLNFGSLAFRHPTKVVDLVESSQQRFHKFFRNDKNQQKKQNTKTNKEKEKRKERGERTGYSSLPQ
jgi:hypothetical protein